MPTAEYRKNISEHRLQVQVLQYLTIKGRRDIYWFAVPNAGRRSMQTGQAMKAEGLRAGIADLCFLFPGGYCAWLEMKTLHGTQSDHQKGFQAICDRLGHRYAIAKTFDQAIEVLRGWEALR